MRKSLLLVGAFLTVAAMAQAKEVVPEPVVVEETPVQVVEKEVIVYRDKEEGFRPSGYVDLQYRWYGDTEGQNEDYANNSYDKDTQSLADGNDNWNPDNNYSRIQFSGKINMTERQRFEWRIRNYGELDSETDRQSKDGTETRLRYFYDHGNLGDSKVNLTSRLHYKDKEHDDGYQEVEYQARFDFAQYMPQNDFIKTSYFVLAPKYEYAWGIGNDDDYDNRVGADLASYFELPWGFSFEFNLYADQHFYGKDHYFDGGRTKEDKNFTLDMEAYIYNYTRFYENGNFALGFYFEGGYDDYSYSQEKMFGEKKWNGKDKDSVSGTDDSDYSLYALPGIQADYQVTPNLNLYAVAGAEYRDWAVSNGSSASDWRWQPTVWAGFRTTF